MKNSRISLLLAVLAFGCSHHKLGDGTQPPPPLSVTSSIVIDPAGSSSLSNVRFVTARFVVIGAGFPSEASLEFVAPNGLPYEVRQASFVGTAYDSQQLAFALPVAGTVADTSGLAGTWTASLMIDGQQAAAPTFTLTQ